MQTLCAGCNKAEPKIFIPPQTPLPGGAGRPKFNQLEMVTTFTYKPSLVRINASNKSYRGNRPTHTQDRLQYTAPQLVHSVIKQTVKSGQSYTTSIFTNICQTLIHKHSSVHFLVKIASQ